MQNLNTDLRLENCDRDEHFLRIRADTTDGNEISIVLNILFKNEMVDLCGDTIIDEEVTYNEPEYFHLDKFQVGVLIDYLKRVRKTM
jgi:hypothetical protein